MGMGDLLGSAGEKALNAVKSKVAQKTVTKATPPASVPKADRFYNPTYTQTNANWYKALPYAFKATMAGKSEIFYLPINPSNLNIVTHYATNMIPTLYGTVEEHSEVRYFDISISGTTGISPKFFEARDASQEYATQNQGRTAYQSGAVFANLAGGFFQQTLNRLDSAVNSVRDTVNAIKGDSNKFQPGVGIDSSGYAAFHNFYRWLLKHKEAATKGQASGKTGETPLYFLNYKDNNQYSVVIQNFSLERSAENPMLYNYRIAMRGYGLRTLSSKAVDGNKLLEERLASLGLNSDKPSIASRFKNGLGSAKGAINGVKGALGSLGIR